MLGTIVQHTPIYVNFTVSEREVLNVRAAIAKRGLTVHGLKDIPVEVGLQTETGYPHKGVLDYVAPTVDPSTGTLAARAELQNADRVLLPGYFVRVRTASGEPQTSLLVPDVALGSDQGGRYVLTLNKDNVVKQRKVEIGPLVGEMRVIERGLAADDRVVINGLMRAMPGQKVEPQMQTAANTQSGAR